VPLHREANAIAMRTEHRGDHLGEVHGADPDPPVVGVGERIEHAADPRRVGMEAVDAGADQYIGIEIGKRLAQLVLLVAQQFDHRAVHVADHMVVVGDHHRRARHIE
jgi:hypothetical protein